MADSGRGAPAGGAGAGANAINLLCPLLAVALPEKQQQGVKISAAKTLIKLRTFLCVHYWM